VGPPNDIPPSELWQKLTERPQPSDIVDFPGYDLNGKPLGKVRIRVLRGDEQDRAKIAAHRYLTETRKVRADELGGEVMRETLGDAVMREILCMACTAPEPFGNAATGGAPVYPRIFQRGEDIAKTMSNADIAVLFGSYLLVQEKYGPTEKTIETPEERDAWIKRLTEGASRHPLVRLPSPALLELAMSLAARAYSLSCTLEYLFSTSPSSLDAVRTNLGPGTIWSGSLPSELEAIGSNPSVEAEPGTEPVAPHVVETITHDAAKRAARAMRGETP
jgi:hypothetical protein